MKSSCTVTVNDNKAVTYKLHAVMDCMPLLVCKFVLAVSEKSFYFLHRANIKPCAQTAQAESTVWQVEPVIVFHWKQTNLHCAHSDIQV